MIFMVFIWRIEIKSLGPTKIAAEALGRQGANLLTSQGIFIEWTSKF